MGTEKKLDIVRLDIDMPTHGGYAAGYPEGAVIHFTAGRSAKGDVDAIAAIKYGQKSGLAFLAVSKTGRIYQAHDISEWGYHAGESYWPGVGHYVSKRLIGIEICCAGMLSEDLETWYGDKVSKDNARKVIDYKDNRVPGNYEKFTVEQEEAVIQLLLKLKAGNPRTFNLDLIVGHDEISPGRKCDPGGSLSMSMAEFRELVKERYRNSIA